MAVEGYDIGSELNRKTYETLNWLISQVNNGKITNKQFSVAIDALFMAVSGLVDSEFIHIITEAQKLCEGEGTW